MTSERKKAILYLVLTLLLGILIGVLVPGFFGRFREGRFHDRKGGSLTHIIERVVKPDVEQSVKIKAIVEQTTKRIDVLQSGCNQEVKNVMDSLKIQLQPLLKPDQLTNLNKFLDKGQDRWKGR